MNDFDLAAAARQEMLDHGFEPDFPPEAERQLAGIRAEAEPELARSDGPAVVFDR